MTNMLKILEFMRKSHQAARRRHNQGRAEDFGIPWALIYSARGASENFLSAPCKFLSASTFFLTFKRTPDILIS